MEKIVILIFLSLGVCFVNKAQVQNAAPPPGGGGGGTTTAIISGPTSVCPGVEYNYGSNSCGSSDKWSWSISGGYFVGSTFRKSDVTVVWYNTSGTKKIYVDNPICTNSQTSKQVTLRVNPGSSPMKPDTVMVNYSTTNNTCPGDVINLEAVMSSDPNSDSDTKNDVEYVWSADINNSSYSNIGVTNENSITYTVPEIYSNPEGQTQIEFLVYTRFKRCSNLKSASTGANAYVYASAPELVYTTESAVCNTKGKLVISDVDGAGSAGTEYLLTLIDPPKSIKFYHPSSGNPVVIELVADTYNYELSYVDGRHCIEPNTFIINDAGYDLTLSGEPQNVKCKPESTGRIDLTVSGGISPLSYLWSNGSTTQDISGLAAGSYSVTVTDGNGCDNSLTVKIDEPLNALNITNAYVSSNYNNQDVSCNGNDDGEITIEAEGGTGVKKYRVTGTTYQDLNVITGLTQGSYNAWVLDENGCETQYSDVIIINEPKLISATIDSTNPICNGGGSGTLTINTTGGTGNYRYSIDGTNFQADNFFGNLLAKDYIITIKDQNGCSTSYNETLVDPKAMILSTSSTEVTCFGGNDGSLSIENVSNGTAPYLYSIDNVNFQTKNTFNGLTSKNYNVIVKDDNGCLVTTSIYVGTKPKINASFVESQSISCKYASDGIIDLTASGGTPPYIFLWSNGSTTEDLLNIGAGTYTVTITDASGCDVQKTYSITEPYELLASANPSSYNGSPITCNGANDGSIDIEVTGGTAPYTYSWSEGSSTQDLSDLSPGTYSVDITDANSCSTSVSSIQITQPDVLDLSVSDMQNVQCFGNNDGKIQLLTAGGTSSYQYSLDATNWQASTTFSGLAPGNYTLYVKDINGCQSQTSASISEPSQLLGNVTNIVNSSCGENNGYAEVSISGGTAPYQYSWTNSSSAEVGTSALLTDVGGDIYTVTVTDANGCTVSYDANISSIDGAVITSSNIQATSCFNSADGEATISVSGYAPFDILWSTGETGETATALVAGDNTVSVTDVNGCTVVEVINIPSPDPITISVDSQTIPTCYDSNDGAISITANGGAGNYTYAWANGTSGNALSDIAQGSYEVTITDDNECSLTTTIDLVGVNPIDVAVVQSKAPTCTGDSDGILEVSASGGNGNYSYTWDNGETSSLLENIKSGDYTVRMMDDKGCMFEKTINLPQAEPFEISLVDTVEICEGSSYRASYPVAGGSYAWTSANGFSSTDEEVVLSDPDTYTLQVTNTKGCKATDDLTLEISNDLLNADFLIISEAYVGDTVIVIDISWPIPDNITWDLGDDVTVLDKNSDFSTLVYKEPGTYQIDMYASLADCEDFFSQSITILPASEKGKANGRIGTTNEDLISAFKAYPNPADGPFQIDIALNYTSDINLQMIDLTGNNLVFDYYKKSVDSFTVRYNNSLTPGLYVIVLKAGGKTDIRRIMIK